MDVLSEILKLAAVGLIAGLFSSWLSNRDFRHRKWWELRATAYQRTIESLSDQVYYYKRHLGSAIATGEVLHDDEKLSKYWQESSAQVRKAADTGAFLFSPEANAILREFVDFETDPNIGYPDVVELDLENAQKCLARLVECSKVDLKLKESLLGRIF